MSRKNYLFFKKFFLKLQRGEVAKMLLEIVKTAGFTNSWTFSYSASMVKQEEFLELFRERKNLLIRLDHQLGAMGESKNRDPLYRRWVGHLVIVPFKRTVLCMKKYSHQQ